MRDLRPCSRQTTFFNFLASHDGIGVRPVEKILNDKQIAHLLEVAKRNVGRVSYRDNGDSTQSPYELNINYFDALQDPNADDRINLDRFMAAQAILVSLAGLPGIYIHSLLGSGNDLEGLEKHGYNRAINREKLDLDPLMSELADQKSRRTQVLERFRRMICLRRQNPAFAPSASQRVVVSDDRLITFVRGEKVAVIINISNQTIKLDSGILLSGISQDLISGEDVNGIVTISPYQVMWLT